MDQSPVEGEPIVFKQAVHHSKLIFIAAFLIIIFLCFTAGYFSNQYHLLNLNLTNNLPKPILTTTAKPAFDLPIATDSSAVKSLYIFYLLSGIVNSITPSQNGYEIQISSPTGPLVNQKFFADKTTNVVRLSSKGVETKYSLSDLKESDPIQLNFQMEIKKNSNIQVTKIAVLK